MNYAVEMISDVKALKSLLGGGIHRQHGDLIILFYFSKIRKVS
jgi:hypothetical protein